MGLMMIGAFAERARLSPKALRLYDRLGLLQPVRTDPVSGYRFYSEDQVADARLIALLRRLGMPLPVIADITAKPPGEAAETVGNYWAGVESVMAGRRVLVSHIQAKLTGAEMAKYDVQTRIMPERTLLSIRRHLHADQTDAFFGDAFARLRSAAPGVVGIADTCADQGLRSVRTASRPAGQAQPGSRRPRRCRWMAGWPGSV